MVADLVPPCAAITSQHKVNHQGGTMNPIKYWRRIVVVLAGLSAALGTLAGAASAATTSLPPSARMTDVPDAAPAVPTVIAGGMPGWQVAAIAVAAALVAAVAAVALDRVRLSRQLASTAS